MCYDGNAAVRARGNFELKKSFRRGSKIFSAPMFKILHVLGTGEYGQDKAKLKRLARKLNPSLENRYHY